MNTQERVIDKIRGLMAKAESSEFEEERNAFLDKATELMVLMQPMFVLLLLVTVLLVLVVNLLHPIPL